VWRISAGTIGPIRTRGVAVKRSRWLLLLALVALIGAVSYQARRMDRGTVGAIDGEGSLAVEAFVHRLESEEVDRWQLKVGQSTVVADEKAGRVIRRDSAGKVEWSTPVEKLRSWSWPTLLTDGRLIYVNQQLDGVTALDAATGLIAWHAPVPAECLRLSGDLLLLAHGSQVVALAAASGAEAFRLPLPAAPEFRPVAIEEAAGLFLVQTNESPGGEGDAFLFDRAGKVRHRFPRQVVAVAEVGNDRLFLTSAEVRRVTPDDKTVWSAPFESHNWIAGGSIIEAPGGDRLAFLYCRIANSGVQVMRFDPASGEVRWQTWCGGLSGVMHSAYRHDATAEWVGERLRVISRGSAGAFVEWLDGGTGKRIRRGEQRGQ
jgi:outer membrane protein assembly factor BamB